MYRKLVLSSRNPKKARELAPLFDAVGIELVDLSAWPDSPEIEETGTTFAENAALKAAEMAKAIGQWTLADDSGIEVDALAGRPGVYSARYAGPDCTDADNNAKLLVELANVPQAKRGAQFVCYLAISDPQGKIHYESHDHCRGEIIHEDRGGKGFGYDPLFLIPEYHQTFGELGLAVKSVLSHRSRAVRKLLATICDVAW